MITPEVIGVAKLKLRKKGLHSECKIITEVTKAHSIAITAKKKLFQSNDPIPYTKEEAVAFLIENDLTKKKYINMRLGAKLRKANIYPKYDIVLEGKKECYPDGIVVSESGCYVPLQNLLDHTSSRILKVISEILKTEMPAGEYELISKWGIGGSSDQSKYKQKFKDKDRGNVEENSLVVVSLVPLELRKKENATITTVWKNLRYSSPLFCRTISFEFAKETQEKTQECTRNIQEQISKLIPTTLCIDEKHMSIMHSLILSMIDGKVCTALTEVSSQRCQICNCPPSGMNNLENASVMGNVDNLGYGISVLHTNIRVFECLLHVSYKLGIKKWRVQGDEDKAAVEKAKLEIQDKFANETGLLVDVVLQGKCTTNDGNTARKFFRDPETSSRITGINVELIKKFSTLLGAINCGELIDADRFEEYALETAKLYFHLYPWYYLPAHTHKLLLHGATVIRNMLLPLGQLSEEAAEAANKIIRNFRRGFTRKDNRIHNVEDLFNRLMVSSDPYISSLRNKQTKQRSKISKEIQDLLIKNEEAEPNLKDDAEVRDLEDIGESDESEDEPETNESEDEAETDNLEEEAGSNDSEEEAESENSAKTK